MRISALIVAYCATRLVSAQTESGTAFRVHVVNNVTGAPIAGANVVLDHEQDDRLWGRTDAEGGFSGRTHSAGSHLLTVTRTGYRMTGGGMGKIVEVKPGVENDATVEMQPLGVLAGRVLDQYGDPVRHAIVHTEDKMSVPGQDQYYQSYSAALTDDRGEYRIAEVEPGKHYVAVEYNTKDEERSSGTPSRYRWPRTGGLVLYPDATDIEQAQLVEVTAGAMTRLDDVHLKIQRGVTISGRIKPPPAEVGQSLGLERTDRLALHSSPVVQVVGPEADGSFKIDALPGKYVLTASDGKSGRASKPLALEVRERDITGLELELTAGHEINGQFAVDGHEGIDFAKLLLNFGGPEVKIDGNGAFHANLLGGKGVYMLQGLPEDWYVKDVLVGGRRIAGRQFEVEPGSADLIFTLSPRGALISISLESAVNRLVGVVALLPEAGPVPDVESILHAEPDASGKFTVRAVPPGSYRVFTLDASNWTLLMQPDVLLEKYRRLAPLISVAEGERKKLVIPVLRIQPE
jgi:hypothetical protein